MPLHSKDKSPWKRQREKSLLSGCFACTVGMFCQVSTEADCVRHLQTVSLSNTSKASSSSLLHVPLEMVSSLGCSTSWPRMLGTRSHSFTSAHIHTHTHTHTHSPEGCQLALPHQQRCCVGCVRNYTLACWNTCLSPDTAAVFLQGRHKTAQGYGWYPSCQSPQVCV